MAKRRDTFQEHLGPPPADPAGPNPVRAEQLGPPPAANEVHPDHREGPAETDPWLYQFREGESLHEYRGIRRYVQALMHGTESNRPIAIVKDEDSWELWILFDLQAIPELKRYYADLRGVGSRSTFDAVVAQPAALVRNELAG